MPPPVPGSLDYPYRSPYSGNFGEIQTAEGTQTLDAADQPGGMSPGAMAGIGMGSMLLGNVFDYLGQRQGAKAMVSEAQRQAQEQEAFSQQRYNTIMGTLAQHNPAQGQGLGQVALQRRMGALKPALAAGGRALGVSQPGQASVAAGMMPQQAVAAQGEGQRVRAGREGQLQAQLGGNLQTQDAQRQMAGSLYDQRLAMAGQAGEGYRMIGRGLQMGMPLVGLAMGRRDPNAQQLPQYQGQG